MKQTLKINDEILKSIMHNEGISSDRQLSTRLGLSSAYVSGVRRGHRGPGTQFIIGMLNEFGVPFNFEAGSLYRLEKEEG